jgi:two-component system, sensor histidine kinase and response regulator
MKAPVSRSLEGFAQQAAGRHARCHLPLVSVLLLSVTRVGRDSRTLGAGVPSGPDFRWLFEGAPGLYLVLDPQLTMVAVSNAYLAATMTTRENILGRNVFEVFPDNPDDPGATGVADLTASFHRVRSELRPDTMAVLQYDVRRSAAKGGGFEVRYWSPRNTPLFDPSGKLTHILHEVVDVTEFVRQEDTDERLTEEFWANTARIRAEILRRSAELAEANQALREANANRKQFLASMSHELRTPMNAVIGLAELLGNTTLSPPQRRYVDGIRTAGHTLLSVISDVLDVSKIEAGKLVLSAIDFSPAAVVEDVVEMVAESARSKNLEVTGFYAPSLPATRSGDPDRLRQVLLNLAGNAVKFTERGEITVRAAPAEAGGAQGVPAGVASIRFEVTDSGIGISPDIQQRLFEPFVQADPSTTRRAGGSGLGLAICRELVTLMGGSIGVSSEPGHGSTFWCVIPFAPASQADHSVSLNVLAGLRVLVVDDNATNRLILDQQLRAWRAETTLCEDAEAALPLLRGAALRGQPYGLSILDLRMPGTDGLALADTIHADGGIPDHPMIMLSSEVDFDQEAADHAGISAVLVKPIRGADLFATISGVMGLAGPAAPGSGTAPGAAGPASTAGQCGRVLLVEDDELSQLAGEGILIQLGYQVEVASDGQQAVAMAMARRYDAIIMDCHMPVMDGYTAALTIHAAEGRGRHTPIIALTAAAVPEERARCAAATMDDYLTKPITAGKIDAHLRRWFSPGGGAAANGRQDEAAAGGSAQRLHDAISGRLGQFLGGDGLADQMLVARILRSVLDGLPGKLADLAQSLQQRDVPRLASTAHTLKGMCQNIGASDLADLCDELPAHARGGRDREAAQALTCIEAAGREVLAVATQMLSQGSAPHPAGGR